MLEEQPQQQNPKIRIHIDPANLVLVGIAAGCIWGALIVLLDPWLRFPDVSLRINWREMLLSASVMSAYAAVLGWTIPTFWRQRIMWVIALMLTPIVTGVIAAWNNINSPFGLESDLLIFLPFVLMFHMATVALVVLYLHIALRFSSRRALAFSAIPVVLCILAFLGLGRLRWSNQDARDVIHAVDRYASGAVNDDYSIEYLGMRYRSQLSPTGHALIHSGEGVLFCRVRLYPQNIDVSCSEEE